MQCHIKYYRLKKKEKKKKVKGYFAVHCSRCSCVSSFDDWTMLVRYKIKNAREMGGAFFILSRGEDKGVSAPSVSLGCDEIHFIENCGRLVWKLYGAIGVFWSVIWCRRCFLSLPRVYFSGSLENKPLVDSQRLCSSCVMSFVNLRWSHPVGGSADSPNFLPCQSIGSKRSPKRTLG